MQAEIPSVSRFPGSSSYFWGCDGISPSFLTTVDFSRDFRKPRQTPCALPLLVPARAHAVVPPELKREAADPEAPVTRCSLKMRKRKQQRDTAAPPTSQLRSAGKNRAISTPQKALEIPEVSSGGERKHRDPPAVHRQRDGSCTTAPARCARKFDLNVAAAGETRVSPTGAEQDRVGGPAALPEPVPGGLGRVRIRVFCVRREIRLKVAVKKLSRPFQSIIHAKRTYRELRLLKHMKHENVIGLLDVFTPSTSLEEFTDVYLVTHLMGADLNNIVKCQKLTDDHVQFLIYQILRGLK
ncbi:hypothetical protein WMY93_031379, partial [Mugilogobius chulae]